MAGCTLVGLFALYVENGKSELNNSIDSLLNQKLELTFKVQKADLKYKETDLSGQWWLLLDEQSMNKIRSVIGSKLARADSADLKVYKNAFRERLRLDSALDDYELYRAEFSLGKNTICEDLPCNIAVLTKNGEKNIYVGISKN